MTLLIRKGEGMYLNPKARSHFKMRPLTLVGGEKRVASVKVIAPKKEEVTKLAEKIKSAKLVLLTDYRGITVTDVTNLRADLRKTGTEYSVIKNNITKRALQEAGIEGLDEQLVGPTAVILNTEDYLPAIKVIYKFVRNNDFYKIKAGVIDGKLVSIDEIKTLAKLPSREELLGKLAGVLLANIGKLAISLDQVRIKKESAIVDKLNSQLASQKKEIDAIAAKVPQVESGFQKTNAQQLQKMAESLLVQFNQKAQEISDSTEDAVATNKEILLGIKNAYDQAYEDAAVKADKLESAAFEKLKEKADSRIQKYTEAVEEKSEVDNLIDEILQNAPANTSLTDEEIQQEVNAVRYAV